MRFLESTSFLQDKQIVYRARKVQKFLSQPFHVAEVFTGISGQYVSVADTIKGFKMILDGECDEMAENDLYMIGSRIQHPKVQTHKLSNLC